MPASVIVSAPNKALAVPRTPGMMGLFPEGKPLGDKLWVIKHGMAEYLILRRLGLRLPNPITCYYDWPRPATHSVFSVQRITCSMMTASPRAYVLNDMGTGKTRCALWSWEYLYKNGYAGKLLIVAPLNTLSRVWGREILEVMPGHKHVILHGTKKKRVERLNDPDAEIFIINHDGLKVIREELAKHPEINVIVIDELAKYRNSCELSKQMVKVVEPMKFAWGMTGSPMPQEPTDVWMQCKILTPHTVPKWKSHAKGMLMTKSLHSDHVWFPKPDAVERAYSWMQPAVRFALDDVVELPDVVTRFIDVPLSPEQAKVYTKVANEFCAMVGTNEINAGNAAAAMNKLMQISGGYVYAGAQTITLDVTPRKELLRDLIQEATGKVLVFFPFRHMVTGLSEYLGDPSNEDYIEHAVIHGDVPLGQRNAIFNDFQDTDRYKAILAHPGCMAHGLTLTRADTVIWYCPIPSLEVYEQANARIRRVGQKHRQQVIHLQGTPVERRVYAMLLRKAKVQDHLLSLFADATNAATGGVTQETTHGQEHATGSNVFSSGAGSSGDTSAGPA